MITGGARSGKSRMALSLANQSATKTFIATAQPFDEEMKARIRAHRAERSDSWILIEEPLNIPYVLTNARPGVVLIDCITLWISNLIHSHNDIKAIDDLLHALKQRSELTIVVTNELGMGIVPDNPLARKFRDLIGTTNQSIASVADEVICMISGLPLYLKG